MAFSVSESVIWRFQVLGTTVLTKIDMAGEGIPLPLGLCTTFPLALSYSIPQRYQGNWNRDRYEHYLSLKREARNWEEVMGQRRKKELGILQYQYRKCKNRWG